MSVSDIDQLDFIAGEVSPRLRGRRDLEIQKHGLARCENFEPMSQGSLKMRAGTSFIRDLTADGADGVRLFQFRAADEQDFLAVLTHLKMNLFEMNGTALDVAEVSTAELVTNGDFSAGNTGWTYVVDAGTTYDFSLGRVAMASGAVIVSSVVLRRSLPALVALADLRFSFHAYDFAHADDRIRVDVGTSEFGHELYQFTGKPSARVTVDLLAVPATTVVWITFVMLRTASGLPECGFSLDDVSLGIIGAATTSDITTPWESSQLAGLQMVLEPGRDRMVIVHPQVAPQSLQRSFDGTWSFNSITFASQPAEWVGSVWPSVCEIFQSRLWLSGLPGESNRLWASRSGSIFDFATFTDVGGTNAVLPSDGIDVKVATKGAVRWMQSGRSLLLGTDLGEHTLVSQSGAIMPSDISIRDESSFGSGAVPAVHAGSLALFVSGDRRKVRGLTYEQQTNGWEARDITFAAEHITTGLVKELHFARDPNDTIVALLDDGTIIACTFVPSMKVVAWWRLTAGQVGSIATVHGAGGSYLWVSVTRGTKVLLERLPLADEAGLAYLDSSKAYSAQPAGALAGLDHLEGQEVSLLIDGVLEPAQTVSGGTVTLARAAVSSVLVGVAYRATARTLPVLEGGPRGSALGARRRRPRVRLLLNDSALPLVNGERAATRSPGDLMDTVEPRTSDDALSNALGWEEDGAITIEQDVPYRTEVIGIVSSASVSEV